MFVFLSQLSIYKLYTFIICKLRQQIIGYGGAGEKR